MNYGLKIKKHSLVEVCFLIITIIAMIIVITNSKSTLYVNNWFHTKERIYLLIALLGAISSALHFFISSRNNVFALFTICIVSFLLLPSSLVAARFLLFGGAVYEKTLNLVHSYPVSLILPLLLISSLLFYLRCLSKTQFSFSFFLGTYASLIFNFMKSSWM